MIKRIDFEWFKTIFYKELILNNKNKILNKINK